MTPVKQYYQIPVVLFVKFVLFLSESFFSSFANYAAQESPALVNGLPFRRLLSDTVLCYYLLCFTRYIVPPLSPVGLLWFCLFCCCGCDCSINAME